MNELNLNGARVALLEARMSGELATLISRYGGVPHCVPAVRETSVECGDQVADLISHLSAGACTIVVFSTGVGATALFQEAEKLGRSGELLDALNRVTTVCRGPKPVAALSQRKIKASLIAQSPYTTAELLAVLTPLDMQSQNIALLHYGERNEPLVAALLARGAQIEELCLYEWLLPEDTRPLKGLVNSIINDQFDAVAFTSQIQARHLFQIASESGQGNELARALNSGPVVVAIGPTCAGALEALGVKPAVVPSPPKMGRMVAALAEYFIEHQPRSSQRP